MKNEALPMKSQSNPRYRTESYILWASSNSGPTHQQHPGPYSVHLYSKDPLHQIKTVNNQPCATSWVVKLNKKVYTLLEHLKRDTYQL